MSNPSSCYPQLKSILDYLLALLFLLLSFPLFFCVWLLVRLFIGHPVLFSQLRPGYLSKPFYLYKFRTMTNETDANGDLLPDSHRLTKFGLFLRSTSLDELPELFNILRGEMSFVGPRPLLMQYLPHYSQHQLRRHEVKPGLSGLAQVNGRNSLTWEQKFALDVWYVDNQSFLLDLRILVFTIWKVILRDGITASSHSTMPPFH